MSVPSVAADLPMLVEVKAKPEVVVGDVPPWKEGVPINADVSRLEGDTVLLNAVRVVELLYKLRCRVIGTVVVEYFRMVRPLMKILLLTVLLIAVVFRILIPPSIKVLCETVL